MKCTTKILLGILLSGIVVVLIGSILLYSTDKPQEDLTFDGKPTQVDVAPFRVVNVWVNPGERLTKHHIFFEGNLFLVPVVGSQHMLSYPEGLERYLSVVAKGDTLNLTFNISASTLPGEFRNKEWIYMKFSEMSLTADSSLVAASSEARRLNLQLLNMKADSVALSASYLRIDSCDFRSLSVNNADNLDLVNSRIRYVYLDLDGMRHWSAVHCQLDNEYLTGSREHYNEIQKGECSQMHWKPKNKDAQLNVTLKQEASVSLLN